MKSSGKILTIQYFILLLDKIDGSLISAFLFSLYSSILLFSFQVHLQWRKCLFIYHIRQNKFVTMQDYPVYRPEKYSGLGLLLTNSKVKSTYQDTTHFSSTSRSHLSSHGKKYIVSPNRSINKSHVQSSPPKATYQAQERIKTDLIKGQSRIEYVPFEKKVIDYVDEQTFSLIPRKRTISQFKDFVKIDIVPRQVISTDYYAVEHIRSYIPQVIPQKYVEYVPVQRKNIKYEYIPIERQILHCPQSRLEEENSRYLGLRQKSNRKTYENIRQQDIKFWERQYGYIRGESINTLNEKIRQKVEKEKELYYKQFQQPQTAQNSRKVTFHNLY